MSAGWAHLSRVPRGAPRLEDKCNRVRAADGYAVPVATICAVHCGQRRALTGIALVHSGHSLVSGSSCARRAIRWVIGATTKKNTAAAIDTNVIRLLMKSPYRKWLPLIVKERFSKLGLPKIEAAIGE